MEKFRMLMKYSIYVVQCQVQLESFHLETTDWKTFVSFSTINQYSISHIGYYRRDAWNSIIIIFINVPWYSTKYSQASSVFAWQGYGSWWVGCHIWIYKTKTFSYSVKDMCINFLAHYLDPFVVYYTYCSDRKWK